MAGDWIQMRHDLPDDPAVIDIAAALGIDEDHVVGKLHRLWSWADRQTIDGNAARVTGAFVDRYVSAPGFAQAMSDAGWLRITSEGVTFPKFDEYISETAKQRALTARRARKFRAKKSNAACVTKAHLKKRREESKKDTTYPKKFTVPAAEEVASYCATRKNGFDAEKFIDFYTARGWKLSSGVPMKDWKAAIRTWEQRRSDEPTPQNDTPTNYV